MRDRLALDDIFMVSWDWCYRRISSLAPFVEERAVTVAGSRDQLKRRGSAKRVDCERRI
jgi:hypothetical protein